jgi:hypothetical protein
LNDPPARSVINPLPVSGKPGCLRARREDFLLKP